MTAPALTVLYDGACPLCAREIGFYRRWRGADQVAWVDVSQAPDEQLPPSLSRRDALARFHAVRADGSCVSGAAAFVALWSVLPAFRGLGWVFRPGWATALLELAYRAFLRVRPRLQRVVTRRPSPFVTVRAANSGDPANRTCRNECS